MRRRTGVRLYQKLIGSGQLKPGYACDNNAGIYFEDNDVKRVVASRAGAKVYYVSVIDGKVVERVTRSRDDLVAQTHARPSPGRISQRLGSSYNPNVLPTGSANAANAPMPWPISVRGVRTLPPSASMRFKVSAITSTMM